MVSNDGILRYDLLGMKFGVAVVAVIDCPSCKSENPEGAKFCVSCGAALQASCAECGSPLPAQARFCPECGHQLAEAQPDSSRATLEQYIPKELLAKLESVRSAGGQLGERRVVTMLFCDVSGSTAAAEKLDPEDWAQIMNGAFAHLIEPVYRYEGTLARLMGDAILAFFGAPIAHEESKKCSIWPKPQLKTQATKYSEYFKFSGH